MMIILIDGVQYQLVTPNSEASLEKTVQANSKSIFGPDSFYFELKKLIRSKAGIASIPDGYAIFFAPRPTWAIVEIELASHPIYEHLVLQLTKFKRGIEDNATRRQLTDLLYNVFNDDEILKAQLKQKIKSGEIYKFVSDLVSTDPLIVIVIDHRTEELNEALRDNRGEVKIIEFKTFRREGISEDVNAFLFEPLVKSSIIESVEAVGSKELFAIPKVSRPSQASEAYYRESFRKQLKNENSMVSKILRYVTEKGEVRFIDLKDIMFNKWNYRMSGAVGASLTVLEQDNYITIEGRGDNKILRAVKRS